MHERERMRKGEGAKEGDKIRKIKRNFYTNFILYIFLTTVFKKLCKPQKFVEDLFLTQLGMVI